MVGTCHGASSLGAPHLSISCWNRQKERTEPGRALDLHYSCFSDFMPGPQTAQIRVFLSIQAAGLRPKFSPFPPCSQAEAFVGTLWILKSRSCFSLAVAGVQAGQR